LYAFVSFVIYGNALRYENADEPKADEVSDPATSGYFLAQYTFPACSPHTVLCVYNKMKVVVRVC